MDASRGGSAAAVGDSGVILQFDGSDWAPVNSDTQQNLFDVFGLVADELVASGSGVVLFYNGSQWSKIIEDAFPHTPVWMTTERIFFGTPDSQFPFLGVYDRNLGQQLFGRTVPSGSILAFCGQNDDFTFVGVHGDIVHSDNAFNFDLLHDQDDLSPLGLTAAWFPPGSCGSGGAAASELFGIQSFQEVLRFDGSGWVNMNAGIPDQLFWLGGTAANDIYALGLPSVAVEMENGADLYYNVYTPGGRLLYRVLAESGARQFYHFDERGNTVFLTDDSGAIVGAYAYDPYGRLQSSAALDNPFTFLGQYGVLQEGDDGLYSIRTRYYDANSGRFLTCDPNRQSDPRVGFPYQYGFQNPQNFVDVDGFNAIDANSLDILIEYCSDDVRTFPGSRVRSDEFPLFVVIGGKTYFTNQDGRAHVAAAQGAQIYTSNAPRVRVRSNREAADKWLTFEQALAFAGNRFTSPPPAPFWEGARYYSRNDAADVPPTSPRLLAGIVETSRPFTPSRARISPLTGRPASEFARRRVQVDIGGGGGNDEFRLSDPRVLIPNVPGLTQQFIHMGSFRRDFEPPGGSGNSFPLDVTGDSSWENTTAASGIANQEPLIVLPVFEYSRNFPVAGTQANSSVREC